MATKIMAVAAAVVVAGGGGSIYPKTQNMDLAHMAVEAHLSRSTTPAQVPQPFYRKPQIQIQGLCFGKAGFGQMRVPYPMIDRF